MADIQHWRRMIQPNRARTPALEPEDSEELLSPPIPQKGRLKRKVSSYFDFHANAKSVTVNEVPGESQLPQWPPDQLYPDLKAVDEMDSIFCRLMSDPYSALDVQFNGSLMRIFESYIKLQDEKDLLQKCLDQEAHTTSALISKFNMAEKDWHDELQDYKEEVKRLEVLLAKASRRGLAEVTLARQDSKLRSRKAERQDGRETIFEFLEKTPRRHDSVYNNQRATMKPLVHSPSDKDKQMSRTLVTKKSMTNIHSDLPFGTPPDRDMRFSLTNMSLLDQKAKQSHRPRAATDASTASTFSAFSCEAGSIGQIISDDLANHEQEDSLEIQRLVTTLARRRNIDPHHVMPQLLNVLRAQPPDCIAEPGNVSSSMPPAMPHQKPTASVKVTSSSSTIKRQTVMSKASGLLQRLKPQPSAEVLPIVRPVPRRFSFEEGDDTVAQSAHLGDQFTSSGQSGEHRLLRKSASLGTLQNNVVASTVVETSLSPVAASPTTPGPAVETQFPSRIPVLSPGSLAKPQAEREDSASSLLTAIKHSNHATKRSSSLTSSAYSSPSASREDMSKTTSDNSIASCLRSVSTNHLLDHTNALRGRTNMIAYAAARAASVSSDINSDLRADRKQPGARGSRSGRSHSQKDHNRQENLRPRQSSRFLDHDTGPRM